MHAKVAFARFLGGVVCCCRLGLDLCWGLISLRQVCLDIDTILWYIHILTGSVFLCVCFRFGVLAKGNGGGGSGSISSSSITTHSTVKFF